MKAPNYDAYFKKQCQKLHMRYFVISGINDYQIYFGIKSWSDNAIINMGWCVLSYIGKVYAFKMASKAIFRHKENI